MDLAQELRQHCTGASVIILSRHDDEETVIAALRSGASGFVLKKSPSGDLLAALHAVARGGTYFSSQISQHLVARIRRGEAPAAGSPDNSRLTRRELEVLRLVTAGNSSKDIAQTLGLSVDTVRSYRKSLMKKLRANNVARLIRIAISQGLAQWTRGAGGEYT